MKGTGLDWAGLMRAGMRDLRLHPDQFWSLTPAELALMLGIAAMPARMGRNRLAELAARYPDAPNPMGGQQPTTRNDQDGDE
ncbi:rcc01693 family protein [Paracoccus sp. (in: a-proteobacteria)]|uniref:rcc01693 family protein n=1 Tax=Paracoccus sp. TaxID=267 RepID=UPI00396CE324